ncbi:hypothetical protein Q8A73_000883 [Channa argus]|nr:hypothetical protein Q8A73_000883 [Channa argus]
MEKPEGKLCYCNTEPILKPAWKLNEQHSSVSLVTALHPHPKMPKNRTLPNYSLLSMVLHPSTLLAMSTLVPSSLPLQKTSPPKMDSTNSQNWRVQVESQLASYTGKLDSLADEIRIPTRQFDCLLFLVLALTLPTKQRTFLLLKDMRALIKAFDLPQPDKEAPIYLQSLKTARVSPCSLCNQKRGTRTNANWQNPLVFRRESAQIQKQSVLILWWAGPQGFIVSYHIIDLIPSFSVSSEAMQNNLDEDLAAGLNHPSSSPAPILTIED